MKGSENQVELAYELIDKAFESINMGIEKTESEISESTSARRNAVRRQNVEDYKAAREWLTAKLNEEKYQDAEAIIKNRDVFDHWFNDIGIIRTIAEGRGNEVL